MRVQLSSQSGWYTKLSSSRGKSCAYEISMTLHPGLKDMVACKYCARWMRVCVHGQKIGNEKGMTPVLRPICRVDRGLFGMNDVGYWIYNYDLVDANELNKLSRRSRGICIQPTDVLQAPTQPQARQCRQQAGRLRHAQRLEARGRLQLPRSPVLTADAPFLPAQTTLTPGLAESLEKLTTAKTLEFWSPCPTAIRPTIQI